MKLVKQIQAVKKDSIQLFRYDTETETLYQQNRSHDVKMSLSDYLFSLGPMLDKAKSQGYKTKALEVAYGAKWIAF